MLARALALFVVASVTLAGCLTPTDGLAGATLDGAVPQVGTTGVFHLADGALADARGALAAMPEAVGGQYPHGYSAPEPTIGIASDGTVFMTASVPAAVRGGPTVMRTMDKGQTWEIKGPRLPTGHPVPPNTNDPYVWVDTTTDRVFMLDLHALVCSTLSWSDDMGESWITNPVGCGHPAGVHDHQTMVTAKPRVLPTVAYDNVVYYCVNRVADTSCATSLNGGLSFGPLLSVWSGVEPGKGVPGGVCGGLMGHLEAAPDGTVYLARARCGEAAIARTMDDGLTWQTFTISSTHPPDDHDVDLAVDAEGNVYAFWQHNGHVWLARSTDQGATWTEPRDVTAPGVTATAFYAIAAGDAGRIAFAYIGTTIEGGYEGKPLGTGGLVGQVLGEPDPKEWAEATWNAYMGIVVDALGDDFVVQTVTANDPADPIARGLCGGTRCHGMTDFIDIQVDAEGRPWASFTDVCTQDCVHNPEVRWDKAIGFAATLVRGPALRGDVTTLPEILPPPVVDTE